MSIFELYKAKSKQPEPEVVAEAMKDDIEPVPDHSKGIATLDRFEQSVKEMQVKGYIGPLVVTSEVFGMFVDPKMDRFTYGSPGVMVEKYKEIKK